MNKRAKNIPASILAKLSNEGKRKGISFDEVLQYYGMERFLYRLSKTKHRDSFILKGGLVFYGLGLPLRRPTRDIDFLGISADRRVLIDEIVKTAMAIPVPDDGIYFDPATIAIQETQVDADRAGVRTRFSGFLHRTEIRIQIDFGFSDELSSEANELSFPALLDGMPKAQLLSYPLEAVIAEKFHAMERFASIPSRWKDYYDIWLISQHFEFNAESIRMAIATTFENRSTGIPLSRPDSLASEFSSRYDKVWKTFLKNSNLEYDEIRELSFVIERIWTFLEHPLKRFHLSNMHLKNQRWDPNKGKWQ